MGEKLTLDQVAEQIGCSKRTVRRLISKGDLPALRIGTTGALVRVDADDLAKAFRPIVPQGLPAYDQPVKRPTPLPAKSTNRNRNTRKPSRRRPAK
jgi:excisionase family DNA binding protein